MHDPEHFVHVVSASVCGRSTPPTSDLLLSLSLSPSLCVCMWTGHINHVEWKEAVYQNKGERNTGNSIRGNNNNFLKSKHVNCMGVL